MSDSISIGTAQAGNMAVGGTGSRLQGGTLNIYAGKIGELRALLEDLVRIVGQNTLPPEVRASAEEALAEAGKPQPDTGRLRQLMRSVCRGAEKIAAVTTAAVNIINLIGVLEASIRA